MLVFKKKNKEYHAKLPTFEKEKENTMLPFTKESKGKGTE
jgi:hypothetical protein